MVLDTIQDWEWVLLLSVGTLEIVILINIFRERSERGKLIGEMRNTRVELGRESYVAMIKDTLGSATSYVYFVSHTLTAPLSEAEKEAIYQLYKPGLDHRCITGKDPGKIQYMWEQRRRGVQVRVNDLLMVSTFRFQLCDDTVAALGFAEGGDEQSIKGILVGNPYFCRMLKQHFLRTWEDSEPLEDYVKEVLPILEGPEMGSSLEELAQAWNLNDDERRELTDIVSADKSQRPRSAPARPPGDQTSP